jgi:small conductance mechanosensitive channel
MTALDILELDKTVSSLLAGVGIIGLALGFAFQDLTSNFISGAFIALRRPFDVGHTVETNGFIGTIEEIQLRSTTLRTSAGLHVIIPNKDIFQKPIINYSRTDARKVEIEFILPNTIDVVFVEKVITSTIKELQRSYPIENIQVFYLAIETPNMRTQATFWTNHIEPNSYIRLKHEAIIALYQAFAGNGIYQVLIPAHEKQS